MRLSWPEAFPLRNVEATTVTNFMSRVVNQFCTLTGIHHLKTSPQTNGMVERFNSAIKRTLRKLQQKSSLQWASVYHLYCGHIVEQYTPLPGFSPHEMLYGRKMRTALDELADCWMDREQCMGTGILEYLDKLKNKIETIRELATEHETRAKQSQKHYYDQRAKEKSFKEGDLVLAVEPMKQN